MSDVLLWLIILVAGWCFLALLLAILFGWFVKRGRYPPAH